MLVIIQKDIGKKEYFLKKTRISLVKLKNNVSTCNSARVRTQYGTFLKVTKKR